MELYNHLSQKMLLRRGLIFILGLAFSLAAGSQIFNFAMPVAQWVAGYTILAIVGTGLSLLLINKVFIPWSTIYSIKTLLFLAAGSVFFGILLVNFIPLNLYPKLNYLRIVATGEKNPQSQGSEVWLISLGTGRRATALPIADVCSGEDWERKDDLLVSYHSQPAQLVCILKSDQMISAAFVRHAWSGHVQIKLDDEVVEADLFSEQEVGPKRFRMPVKLGPIRTALRILIWIATGMWFGLAILTSLLWFVKQPAGQLEDHKQEAVAWYFYALPMAIAWLLYLLAFWPGLASLDVLEQWRQATLGDLNNWHPAFHTLSIWIFSRLGNSLSTVALVQIVTFSSLIGWFLSRIERLGSPRWLRWLIITFFALAPSIGLMVISLWKDTAYSIAVVALTLLVFQIVTTDGKWLENAVAWLILAIVASMVALFRLNGPLVAFGTLISLLLIYPKYFKRLGTAIALALGIWLLVIGPLYKDLSVSTSDQDNGRNLALEFKASELIWWHLQADTKIYTEEQQFFKELIGLDLELIRQSDIDETLAEGELPSEAELQALYDRTIKYSKEIKGLALKLSFRNPIATIGYLSYRSSFIFQILKPANGRIGYIEMSINTDQRFNPFGFETAPKSKVLNTWLSDLNFFTQRTGIEWLFWRNAFWMYLLIFSVIVACLRMRTWKFAILLFPILINGLPLIFFSGGQIYRYISSTVMLGPLLCGPLLMVARNPLKRKAGAPLSSAFKSAFNLQSNQQAFQELASLLTQHWKLTYEMARREITDRYAGQFFGIFWTFIHPLILILVYVFLFNFVFVTKIGGTIALPLDMTAYILAGVIPWLTFSDVMGKASTMIINHTNLVKQAIFPIEVLPIKGVLSSLFTQFIFLGMMIIYTLMTSGTFWWTYILLPILLLVQMLAMAGASYIFAAIGTYIRDTKDFVQVFINLGLWFIPVLYLPEAIPGPVRPFLYLNPFTHMVWCFQDVLYFGRIEHPIAWVVFPLISLVAFLYGYRLFRKLKIMFGNVL